MKKSDKIVMFLLIGALFLCIGYSLLSETYSTSEGITNEFIIGNINKLNSILKEKKDTTNPYFLTEIVDDNGNVPAYEYYSHIPSRSIKELKAYDGKIFMGIGDWTANTGPVKIIYYDTTDGKIKTSGTIPDEAVESFNIIDGTLYTTGTDPKNGWGYGSYYVYNEENNNWEQHELNNGWIHVFDIEKINNKLFMCGSTTAESKRTPVQVSYDNGETFQDVVIMKNGAQLPYDNALRFYGLEKFNNTLYAYTYSSVGDYAYNGIYQYDEANNQFNFVRSLRPRSLEYGLDESVRYNYLHFKNNTVFNNSFIYVSGSYLYVLKDFFNYTKIEPINNDVVQDAVVHDDTLYALYYTYNEDKSFTTRIYSTKDLSTFDLVYEFVIDSFPFSIEYYDNSLYIGTNYHEDSKDYSDYSSGLKTTSEAGSLYQIDLDKFKKYLTLDEENQKINITIDGMTYPVNYDFSSEEHIFETTLSFDNSMSQREWEHEFSKLEYLNLLYTLVCNNEYINYDSSVSYYNNILYNNVDGSSDVSTALEFAKTMFSENLNIQDQRFTITTKNVSETEDSYEVLVTLTVNDIDDKVTSEKYIVNDESGYIYIGTDNDARVIENNVNFSPKVNVSTNLDNNKLFVKYNDDVLNEYLLIGFSTDIKIVNKYMYVGNLNDDEVLSKINIINCDKTIDNNKLQIKVDDVIIDEYSLVRVSSDELIITSDDKIYASNKLLNEIKENINVINAESIVYSDKIEIVSDNTVISEIEILSINFGTFSLNNKTIIVPDNLLYDGFINEIKISTGVIYKLFNGEEEVTSGNIENGMTIKIYYNEEEVDKFDIITEYLVFDDSINVDEENKYLSSISLNTKVSDILSKIDTSGTITVTNNKDEVITDASLIGTGTKITVKLSNKVYEYQVIIKGDLDGDGTLTLPDIIKISMYVYGSKDSLSGVYLKAADYDNNNLYNLQDIMKAANKLYKGGN